MRSSVAAARRLYKTLGAVNEVYQAPWCSRAMATATVEAPAAKKAKTSYVHNKEVRAAGSSPTIFHANGRLQAGLMPRSEVRTLLFALELDRQQWASPSVDSSGARPRAHGALPAPGLCRRQARLHATPPRRVPRTSWRRTAPRLS